MAATTTITLGVGGWAALVAGAHGLAALAGGAAILSVVSLGLAGAALGIAKKGYYGKGHDEGGGYGGGYGGENHHKHGHTYYGDVYGKGYGGGGGYGYKRHGYAYGNYRRKKRSADEESAAVTNLLQVIRNEDVTGCGLKLVCELAGMREEELYEEEIAILNLVGPVVPPGHGLLPPGGAGDYKIARLFGQQHGDCSLAFPLCPFNGTELMGALMSFLP
ncbi:hypothetical protein SK128_009534 [Halocaridina rubra]|uniref:Uncharacterized protein n=1 Tax=Halocaridina rubra TaxID=373956 RepID=A0AAN8WZC3_HALRR